MRPQTSVHLAAAAALLLLCSATVSAATEPARAAPAPVTIVPPGGPTDTGFRSLGSETAPVSIIEFTDLQCPYCARYAQDTWPELKAKYVDTGKVRYTARDLPLPMHAHALPAAIAARCAGRQGHFWDFREAVFRDQASLAQQPWDALARRFGLDLAAFNACRADPKTAQAIQEDVAVAHRNEIMGTPSFVVGRLVDGRFEAQLIRGAQPIEAFRKAIDAILAQQPQP